MSFAICNWRGSTQEAASKYGSGQSKRVLKSFVDRPECRNSGWGKILKAIRLSFMAVVLAATLGTSFTRAQDVSSAREQNQKELALVGRPEVFRAPEINSDSLLTEDPQQPGAPSNGKPSDGKSSLPEAPSATANPANQPEADEQYGKQPKRILGIIPNYRAVSANTQLPPLSFKGAMWLATQDTFDYSSFLFVGGLAGISMAGKSQPSFGQGAEGYGKYYWHTFADNGIENYMTEAIVPVLTREDPRYYTLGKGGLFKRSGYAFSRLLITRTNSGGSTLNLSEIVGAGAAAGIGNVYYPPEYNPWVKTYQRWGTQVGLDGVFNVLKEFWPDIDQKVFHGKY
jgi:hypothetical protein